MKTFFTIALIFVLASTSIDSIAQSNPSKRSLLELISEIEQSSEMRFLYREALISNVKVDISATSPELYSELKTQLATYNIGLHIDEERNQALLYKTNKNQYSSTVTISGYVIDAKTGDRLPYSTISWFENDRITGIASNTSGTFDAKISTSQSSISMLFSFVGYESKKIDFDLSKTTHWKDVAIRLEPALYGGNEIIINGTALFTPSDTVFSSLIEAGSFSPLGDNNAVQALQSLPSVLAGPAIEDGLHVRGSSSDGFRILLDGLTLYNQSHLFGLLDGLNGDVLRTSGFFYDVTPAQFRAPLGGTLSFLTKTGNLQRFNSAIGLSNTAFSGMVEGPISKGTSSFLASGRYSYIDDVNWFNNQRIIEYGLDINRDYDFQADTIRKIANRRIGNITGNAFFYDLNSKLYLETVSGSQIILSSYFAKDKASQSYQRRILESTEDFSTNNEWSNKMISLAYNTNLGNKFISESSVGFSDYYSSYFKEDNDFRRVENDTGQGQRIEILPFALENKLQEFQLNQKFNKSTFFFDWDFGFTYSDFEVLYTEISPGNQSFRSRRTSQLFDLFSQFDFSSSNKAHLSLGSRLYYFSNGKYLKWSPRIKAQFFPESAVSFGLGYSRNYQFLNQLDFVSVNSTDFWVLSNIEQPPSLVDYFTTNIRLRPTNSLYIQVEGYYKIFENLRIHRLTSQFISSFFDDDETLVFLFNNNGIGQGIEFLIKQRFNQFTISSTYSLSSIELENTLINGGRPFHPSYDRTHQFSLMSDINITPGLSFYTSWNYATGTPNIVLKRDKQPENRIGNYSRLDASIKYVFAKNGYEKAEFLFSVYNILNRENPWYSEIKAGRQTERNKIVLGAATIYDLGIQPSFKVKVYF